MKLYSPGAREAVGNDSTALNSSPSHFPRKQRILIVDDDENARDLEKILLYSAGYLVDAAADGEEAWQMLRSGSYDLLLTDQNMPRLTGLELIARLRASGMILPVILNSAWPGLGEASDYPHLALAEILPKPNFAKVLDAVKRTLSSARGEGGGGSVAAPPVSARRDVRSLPRPSLPAIATQLKKLDELHNRILIADDDTGLRGSLAAALGSEGYLVDEAANGREAVARANSQKPDLVLLDLKMPQWDGWTALSQLDRTVSRLPVIVITALPDQYQKAVQYGADAFMEKPLHIPALLHAIKQLTSDETHRDVPRITWLLDNDSP